MYNCLVLKIFPVPPSLSMWVCICRCVQTHFWVSASILSLRCCGSGSCPLCFLKQGFHFTRISQIKFGWWATEALGSVYPCPAPTCEANGPLRSWNLSVPARPLPPALELQVHTIRLVFVTWVLGTHTQILLLTRPAP